MGMLLLAVVLWLVYRPVLDAPFIFDDASTLVGNPSIRQLSPLTDGGPLDPPPGTPVSGRPLVNLSFALNYHYGQLNPSGYRVVQLALHAIAAMLLWSIVARTLRLEYFQDKFARLAEPLGFAVAAVWTFHPLTIETVAYVTQRTELLMGMCYLGALYASLRYWSETCIPGRTLWLIAAAAVSCAGMLSKEMMASAPWMILLYERTFLTGTFRVALRKSWPLYLALAVSWLPVIALNLSGPRTPETGFGLGVSASTWWLTQCKVLFLYLKLAIWPWPLVIHYEIPYLTNFATAWPWVLAATALAILAIVLVWRRSAVGFVLAWVFAVLSPTLLIPLVQQTAAERRMYVPLTALAALGVVGGLAAGRWLSEKLLARSRIQKNYWLLPASYAALLAGLVAVYLTLDARRLEAFASELTLWHDTVVHQPENPLARINLGIALADSGHTGEAIDQLNEALRLEPDSFRGHYNLARAYETASKPDLAVGHYRDSLRIQPQHAASHNNLGRLLAAQGDTPGAIRHYEDALVTDPNLAEAHTNLAILLMSYGYTTKAVHHFEEALRLKPDLAAHTNLTAAYARTGRMDDAREVARTAIRLAQQQGNDTLARQLEAALAETP